MFYHLIRDVFREHFRGLHSLFSADMQDHREQPQSNQLRRIEIAVLNNICDNGRQIRFGAAEQFVSAGRVAVVTLFLALTSNWASTDKSEGVNFCNPDEFRIADSELPQVMLRQKMLVLFQQTTALTLNPLEGIARI